MKKMLLSFLMLLPLLVEAQEPYAVLSENNTVLTFYYDNQKESRNGMFVRPFEKSEERGWYDKREQITSVTFDESFATCESITSTAYWFDGMRNLTSIIGLENLKTDNVTNMTDMFAVCSSLTSIDVSHFNTENVENMFTMFADCESLKNIDLSSFNTAKVKNMAAMFVECRNLESIDVSSFNTSNVIDMSRMFEECMNIQGIDVSSFNTSNVQSMNHMFDECTRLKQIDLSSFNTSNVTDMNCMFNHCETLESIDLSSFDTSKVTDMRYMFAGNKSLNTIYVSNTWSTSNNSAASGNMFKDCTSLVGGSGTVFDANHTDYAYAHIDGGTANPGYLTLKSGETPDVGKVEAYAVLSEDNTVLTFYYDNQKESRNGMDIGPFAQPGDRGWNEQKNQITSVVFDITFANCTTITSTAFWFNELNNLVLIIGLQNLPTYNVTDMRRMFFGCSGLTSLDVSNFNTENVTNMGFMFSGCSGLASLDVSNFNTENVTHMVEMFSGCSGLTSLDVSNFNTENVTLMLCMFSGCNSLTKLDVRNLNTEKVTNMGNMFHGCSSLTKLDVSNFKTDNVTNMGWMFSGCSGLTSLDVSNFKTDNVTNMKDMFSRCSSLTSLDVSGFNTSNVTNMYNMFSDCSSLIGLDVSNFKTDKVTDMQSMFENCNSLTSLDVSNFNTSNVKDMSRMFSYCYSLTSLDVSNFNTSNVKDMSVMFDSCISLISLDVSNFNTDNVTNMRSVFSCCNSLTSLDVSNFNTDNVTNMKDMFSRCSSLTSLDVSNFNTDNVTGMSYMFFNCSSLTSLDVSNFNTSNVTDMANMFYNCSNLKTISVGSHWTTNAVVNSDKMFDNCNSLVGGDGTVFDSNYTDKTKAYAGAGGYLTLKEQGTEPDNKDTGWYTLIDKIMVLDGSSTGEYMILRSDGYLVWNNKGDGDLTIKVYVDPDDSCTLRFDDYPNNYQKITAMDGNSISILAENGITRTFTIGESIPKTDLVDGDTFTATTIEGVTMTFQIISTKDMTCQVGTGSVQAIAKNVTGVVTIPSEAKGYKVVKIANRAFKEITGLTQVVIPNTITDIGTTEFQSAMGPFHCCTGITSFDIPSSVKTIGRGAFTGTMAKTLIIPESVTVIGSNAFDGCANLVSIELSPNIRAIQLETFRNCKSLESIEIPAGVTTIGYHAFQNCTSLATVTSHIESPCAISADAFTRYDATLYVPTGTVDLYENTSGWKKFFSTIKEIGADEFSFTTSKGLTYTGTKGQTAVAVKAAKTDLAGDIIIAEVVMNAGTAYSVTEISFKAFEGCSSIEKITLPKSLAKIGGSAFFGCTSLSAFEVTDGAGSLSVVDGVLYADNGAKLVAYPAAKSGDFEIPATVTSLHDGAFAYASITSLTVNSKEPLRVDKQTFEGIDFENCVLNVPLGSAAKYRSAEGWSQFKHISGETELTIDGATYAIYEDGNVIYTVADKTNVSGDYVIPSTINVDGVDMIVKEIAPNAFEDCSGLISVTIPKSIETIGASAFKGCTGLEEIYCLSAVPIDLSTVFRSRTRGVLTRAGGLVSQFDGVDFDKCILYVPYGSLELYMAAEGWMEFANIVEMDAEEPEVPATVSIVVTDLGKCTYCTTEDLDFSSMTDVKAYVATGYDANEGIIWMTRVKDVPAGTGFFLKGEAGNYDVPVRTSRSCYRNMLEGTVTGCVIPKSDENYTYLYLTEPEGQTGLAFCTLEDDSHTMGANRAYLRIPKTLSERPASASATTEQITIGSMGKATYCSSNDLDFSGVTGLQAYTATGYSKGEADGTVWMTRVYDVPAGTGIFLKGTAGVYDIPTKTYSASSKYESVYENMLVGTVDGVTIPSTTSAYKNMYLTESDGQLKFCGVAGDEHTMGQNKAYLQLPLSVLARTRGGNMPGDAYTSGFCDDVIGVSVIMSEGHTTGIQALDDTHSQVGGYWYNLNGQRVDRPAKGLYIRNGKKVVVK